MNVLFQKVIHMLNRRASRRACITESRRLTCANFPLILVSSQRFTEDNDERSITGQIDNISLVLKTMSHGVMDNI